MKYIFIYLSIKLCGRECVRMRVYLHLCGYRFFSFNLTKNLHQNPCRDGCI